MITLVIATRNRHKAGEFAALTDGHARCVCFADWPEAPELVEDAPTFAGNARRKVEQVAAWLRQHPAIAANLGGGSAVILADDSGLEVDALGGAPGVHSARFAAFDGTKGNATDRENNAKLLGLLKDVPPERRTARFRCALASLPFGFASGKDLGLFEGACEGRIIDAPRGSAGFGYDPLFVPDGFSESFAELGAGVKNQISHRARALAALRPWLMQFLGSLPR